MQIPIKLAQFSLTVNNLGRTTLPSRVHKAIGPKISALNAKVVWMAMVGVSCIKLFLKWAHAKDDKCSAKDLILAESRLWGGLTK